MSSSDVIETGTVSRQVCAIVLAGGVGKRMKADVPKQFLVLDGQTILHRSLELFLSLPEVTEVSDPTRDSLGAAAQSYRKICNQT